MSALGTADGIVLAACLRARITPQVFRSRLHQKRLAAVRQAVVYAVMVRTGWELARTARYMARKDHTTARYAYRKVARLLAAGDAPTTALVEHLMVAPAVRPLMLDEQIARVQDGRGPLLEAVASGEPVPDEPLLEAVASDDPPPAPRYADGVQARAYAQKRSQALLEAMLVERGVLRASVAGSGGRV